MSFVKKLFLCVMCLMAITFVRVWASSTPENQAIAEANYPNSAPERFVATHLGDELPRMRDDLIRMKDQGMGPIERHARAWTTPNNWRPNFDAVRSWRF